MKKNFYFALALSTLALTSPAQQDNVDYKKFPDYSSTTRPDWSLMKNKQNGTYSKSTSQRPAYVNNAETKYFPPVFNQDGGSCGSASRIGYMFNLEINSYRNLDGSKEENQYPTHFTWLLTNSNSGKEDMAMANGIPNRVVYGGRTYSSLFGNQDCSDNNFGWMQGYDKWYSAMQNRISSNGNFPLSAMTEEGREAIKNWLWNHNGDTDFSSGGVCGIGVASAMTRVGIPSTPTNLEAGVVGKQYVASWGSTVDHALTIVGYDDRIEFDLDSNGVYGEKDKDEVGAWIIVNSWGSSWANNGFIYCPYKYSVSTGTSGSAWYPEVYYARKNYTPLRTMKIRMDYSKRSEIAIGAGISANLDDTVPQESILFEHFKYAGDGDGDSVDAETPMLGKWVDGVHYEPMEFGYDLTDLSAGFDTRQPLKYFLVIQSKSTASGIGHVYDCSVIDYEFDKLGIEYPANIDKNGITVKNAGGTTYISFVVQGEPIHKPINLTLSTDTLQWAAPQSSYYTLKNYNIYESNALMTSVPSTTLSYKVDQPDKKHYVTAVYDYEGKTYESAASNSVCSYDSITTTNNYVQSFTDGGFTIPNVFDKKYSSATIEYKLKPTSLTSWNQQVGQGWGKFLIHTTSSGQIYAGWSTGTNNRVSTSSGILKVNTWSHIAVTVNGNVLTLYVNGEKLASTTGTYSGLGGFGDLLFGYGTTGQQLNARIDEVRIWSMARTQDQIKQYMNTEIGNPASEDKLLAYYKMDQVTDDEGTVKLRDWAGDNDATFNSTHYRLVDNTALSSNSTVSAGITLPDGPYYANEPITFSNSSSPNATSWIWTAEGAGIKGLNVKNPQMTFTQTGEQSVTLRVKDAKGNEDETSTTLTIENAPLPEASFYTDTLKIPAGEQVHFYNTSTATKGSTYKWSMPGATASTLYSVNATNTFPNAGEYTVTLTVSNATGISTSSKTIKVVEVAPKSAFTVRPAVVIKGETVYLEDNSTRDPQEWSWTLSNDKKTYTVDGQNSSFTPTTAGIYDAYLTTGNAIGYNTTSLKKALTVCNADGETGLKFGDGIVSLTGPLSEGGNEFTIDWWMYQTKLSNDCNFMGSADSIFSTKVNANGAMTLTINGKTVTTDNDYIQESQWHHYAITFRRGIVGFYRDGVNFAQKSMSSKYPGWTNGLQLGSEDAPMQAIIDEFRIWNKALTLTKLNSYNNQPISDMDAAKSDGLQLYYQFNQNSGNVIDASGNNYTGIRSGFGPEGDAWSSSKGIFCLNTSSVTNTDITADYLTNYKAPFLYTDTQVNTYNENYKALEAGTSASAWKLTNTVVNGNITTGFYVDTSAGSALYLSTSKQNFASTLTDYRAFQTITLPAGAYSLDITAGSDFDANGAYLVVAEGDTLPTYANIGNALTYAALSDKTMTFTLSRETTVSLGFLVNKNGASVISINALKLQSLPCETLEANGVTGVQSATVDGNVTVSVSGSILTLQTVSEQLVQVYDLTGKLWFSRPVQGTQKLTLPKGVYLVNGKKYVIG